MPQRPCGDQCDHQRVKGQNDRQRHVSDRGGGGDRGVCENSCSCSMCKRQIINAGIETVYVRDTEDEYRVIPVQQWIDEDESLEGTFGY